MDNKGTELPNSMRGYELFVSSSHPQESNAQSSYSGPSTSRDANNDDLPPAYNENEFLPPPQKDQSQDDHVSNNTLHMQQNSCYNEKSQQLLPQDQHHLPARASPSQRLQKPIVIPATSPALGSPFLRAYPPSLGTYQVTRECFLEFLDGLNCVAVKSPPLQVLGLAGEFLGFVPLGTVQIIGSAINAAASVETIAASKGATEPHLRKANREIFIPRGLKVEVAKLEAVARVADIPILDDRGRLGKDARFLVVIEDKEEMRSLTVQQRRLQALEPWVARLDVDPLPAINMDSNALGKLHTMASERQRNKDERKALNGRGKAHTKQQEELEKAAEDRAKELSKLEKDERRERAKEHGHKLEEKLQKIEREREKVEREYEKEIAKVSKDFNKDDKESKGMRKILWLVIRNLDAESGPGTNPDVEEDLGHDSTDGYDRKS